MRKLKQCLIVAVLGLGLVIMTGCRSHEVNEAMLTSDGGYWRVDNLPEAISVLQFKKDGKVKCYTKNYADYKMGQYQVKGQTLTVEVQMYDKPYTFTFNVKKNRTFTGNLATNQGTRKVTLVSVDDDYIKQAKEGNKRRGF